MKIVQVFRSASDDQTIGEIEVVGATTPIPIAGDIVHWIANDKVHTGRVVSRLISYGAHEMSVGRDDDFDITLMLTVDLDKE
jgi:plastocyanin